MTSLSDVLDLDLLHDHLNDIKAADGVEKKPAYVRHQTHPGKSWLSILNYTEAATFRRMWDEVTTETRGLIYNNVTGEVLARPFPKFKNYGEHEAGTLDLQAPVEVTDKQDGSLGILYHDGEDWAIATRGSFASEQAIHATKVLRERYLPIWQPLPGVTSLWEIVYPGNRIVLDYGDMDDLVLLGARHIETGVTYGPNFDLAPGALDPWQADVWPGPRTEVLPYHTLAATLAAPGREQKEGVVVFYPDTDLRVKVKQETYVILHKIITGLNERAVWEALVSGKTVEDICSPLPDEFHKWVQVVADSLFDQFFTQSEAAAAAHQALVTSLHADYTRKEFAVHAAKHPDRALLFLLEDGKSIDDIVWKGLKPPPGNYINQISEDVA